MQDKNNNGYAANTTADDNGVNIHKIIGLILSHWVWFAVSLFLTMLLAFILMRYSTPVYKVNATVLINDDQKTGDDKQQLLQDLGFLSGKGNVDNEVEIFKSRSLMETVVKDMQLNIRYFSTGRVKGTPLYTNAPFHFVFVPLNEDSVGKDVYKFTVKLNGKDKFTLKSGSKRCKNLAWEGKWGETVQLPIGKLMISKNPLVTPDEDEYRVEVKSTDETVEDYRKALNAAIVNKQVTLINLALQSDIPKQGEDVLNKLIQVYMQANVEDKNKIADSTMRFIDDRVVLVGEELTGIEKQIEKFKKDNELTDISEQSKVLLGSTSDYMKQLTQSEVQLSIVENLQRYLRENATNRRVVPSSLVIQDPTFVSLIDKYNALQLERERLLMSTTEDNPMVRSLDQQLDNLRGDVNNSLASVKRELEVGVRELRARTGGLDEQIRAVPTKERVYLEYSRQQNVKQELYLFLLQKREETAITKSSTIANVRIVDPAKSETDPYKPKRIIVFFTAILLGLIIPGAAIYIKQLVNTKIEGKDDITDRTKIAIVGEIGHKTVPEKVVVVEKNSRDKLSEQFRVLRTNVQFLLKGGSNKTIMTTSTMSGEGKSFIAINLASALALTGKRVVLIDLDLRKPKIARKLRLERGKGFTNYIMGQGKLEDVLQESGTHENLMVITSGPIPPNPAEILMMPEVNRFFDELRAEFDYIVVDTAPIGLVTDAQLIDHQVDTTLYIVRQGYTYKQQVNFVNELYITKKMPHLSIVVNDVKTGNGYDSNYGYSYAGYYGYDSYYEGDDEMDSKQGLLERIKMMAQRGGLN